MLKYINAETRVTIQLFDDEHEEYITREMTVEEALDAFTEEGCPTIVDAEPVRHGYWDDMGDFEQCSVCHDTHLKEIQTYYGKGPWVKTPYCPECGAKMDKEKGKNETN